MLVLEPSHRATFAAAVGRDFERHLAIERQLPGQVHVAERPPAEQTDNFEIIDFRAGQEGHWRLIATGAIFVRAQLDGLWRLRSAKTGGANCLRLGEDHVRDFGRGF